MAGMIARNIKLDSCISVGGPAGCSGVEVGCTEPKPLAPGTVVAGLLTPGTVVTGPLSLETVVTACAPDV